VPVEALEETRKLVVERMEGALELKVPLLVEAHSGANWAEAHG
jgi:DNA polymerase-1